MNKLTAFVALVFVFCFAASGYAQNFNRVSDNASRMSIGNSPLLLIGVAVVMLVAGVGIGFAIGKKR